jgi:hypothetical protein
MRAYEFLAESRPRRVVKEALAMREYAHPEEYLIRDGTDAGIEILEEFKEDLEQPESLNIKWDGQAAIYWGKDESGKFYMVPMNQWNKGQKLDDSELAGEIKKTGRKRPEQSDEEFAASRQQLADSYLSQWKLLEKSSPEKGFYWGDIMFDSPPSKNSDGVYEFTPNKVTYRADPEKLLGRAIESGASVFIAVHGLVKDFGVEPTSQLTPVPQVELEKLNRSNPSVFLLSEKPTKSSSKIDTAFIDQAISVLNQNKSQVDSFISYTAPRFTGLKNILRDYINSVVKNKGRMEFVDFLAQSKLSDSQQSLVKDHVEKNPKAFASFLQSVKILISTKDRVFAELQKSHSQSMQDRLGITSSIGGKTGGEGFAKIRRSGSGIKYVNPEFRSAPIHSRFGG